MSDQPGYAQFRPHFRLLCAEDIPANRAVREKHFSFDRKCGAQLRGPNPSFQLFEPNSTLRSKLRAKFSPCVSVLDDFHTVYM
jgi:hypothetical protein